MSSVDLLLEELREVTQEAVRLDLNEEANHGLLLSLQTRQSEIRNQMEGILSNSPIVYTAEQVAILHECFQLEQQDMVRKMKLKAELGEKLSTISTGKKRRSAYQGERNQYTGFFIDRHR